MIYLLAYLVNLLEDLFKLYCTSLVVGWVAGDGENIAISSFNYVEVEDEDELGNFNKD